MEKKKSFFFVTHIRIANLLENEMNVFFVCYLYDDRCNKRMVFYLQYIQDKKKKKKYLLICGYVCMSYLSCSYAATEIQHV